MDFKNFEDNLSLLIEVLQNYEFLYDLKHKDYKNNLKKEQAWKEISEIVNISVEDCMRHWKNLRDRFTKEKRLRPSGSQAPESNWPYFEKMLFYNKVSKPRKTFTMTPTVNTEGRPSSSCSSSAWSSIDVITSPQPELEIEIEQEGTGGEEIANIDGVASSETAETPSKRDYPRNRCLKRKNKDDLDDVLETARKIARSLELKEPHKNDPNKSFVEYVYSRLSEMTAEGAKGKRRQMLLILEED